MFNKKLSLAIEEILGRVARTENTVGFLYDNFELQLQGHSLPLLLSQLNFQRNSREHWLIYKKKKPKISVIIPVSRSVEIILNTVNSVLDQTYANFELILVSETIRPSLTEAVKKLKDKRIKLIDNSPQRKVTGDWANWAVSGGKSRSVGLEKMTGDFFTYLDDDDYMLPHKLETCLEFAKSNNYELVGHLEGEKRNGKIEVLRENKINKTRKFHSGAIDYTGLNTNTIFIHKFYSQIKWPIYNYKNLKGNDPIYLRILFSLNPIYALLPEVLVLNRFSVSKN